MDQSHISRQVQLGQASMNPPDLCLKWGELQLCRQPALKFQVRETSAFQAWLPAKVCMSLSLVLKNAPDRIIVETQNTPFFVTCNCKCIYLILDSAVGGCDAALYREALKAMVPSITQKISDTTRLAARRWDSKNR